MIQGRIRCSIGGLRIDPRNLRDFFAIFVFDSLGCDFERLVDKCDKKRAKKVTELRNHCGPEYFQGGEVTSGSAASSSIVPAVAASSSAPSADAASGTAKRRGSLASRDSSDIVRETAWLVILRSSVFRIQESKDLQGVCVRLSSTAIL